jgi:hypothetical protein
MAVEFDRNDLIPWTGFHSGLLDGLQENVPVRPGSWTEKLDVVMHSWFEKKGLQTWRVIAAGDFGGTGSLLNGAETDGGRAVIILVCSRPHFGHSRWSFSS